MDLFVSGIFTLVGFALIILYVYAFVLLWRDEKFSDAIKLAGTLLFIVVGPATWIYLIYRVFRN